MCGTARCPPIPINATYAAFDRVYRSLGTTRFRGKPKSVVNLFRGHTGDISTRSPTVAAFPCFSLANLYDHMLRTAKDRVFVRVAKVIIFRNCGGRPVMGVPSAIARSAQFVVSSELGPIYLRSVIRAVAGLGEPIELSGGVRAPPLTAQRRKCGISQHRPAWPRGFPL